jgi:hypothetical protein
MSVPCGGVVRYWGIQEWVQREDAARLPEDGPYSQELRDFLGEHQEEEEEEEEDDDGGDGDDAAAAAADDDDDARESLSLQHGPWSTIRHT